MTLYFCYSLVLFRYTQSAGEPLKQNKAVFARLLVNSVPDFQTAIGFCIPNALAVRRKQDVFTASSEHDYHRNRSIQRFSDSARHVSPGGDRVQDLVLTLVNVAFLTPLSAKGIELQLPCMMFDIWHRYSARNSHP